jgi:OFA family oxalate/formate antiporter-like MFS transporter
MDFYGVKHYSVNFSIINLNLLIASFGGTLAGAIYDREGSFSSIFMIMLFAIALALVCALLIRRPVRNE